MDNKGTGQKERREYMRFPAREGAVAAMQERDRNLIGNIVDISMGGVALNYIDNGKPSPDGGELALLSTTSKFYLPRLPVRTINDRPQENDFAYSQLRIRKRSLQFTGLSIFQQQQLETFIRRHTTLDGKNPLDNVP